MKPKYYLAREAGNETRELVTLVMRSRINCEDGTTRVRRADGSEIMVYDSQLTLVEPLYKTVKLFKEHDIPEDTRKIYIKLYAPKIYQAVHVRVGYHPELTQWFTDNGAELNEVVMVES